MPKKRRTGAAKRPATPAKRNPLARSLASPLFRNRAEPKPDVYRRRPKHPKPVDYEPD